MDEIMISKQKVQAMYQSGAKHYDFTTILFRLIGLRMKTYRLLAIKNLALLRGKLVIELGCGTGLNFPLLIEQIGPEGRLVGVDLTPGMLEIARERVERSGWKNGSQTSRLTISQMRPMACLQLVSSATFLNMTV
jgi:demethylmenaquinone methyltransferase/2-methoxy-6-polyprenyl-1,4-benzoquinol methylase